VQGLSGEDFVQPFFGANYLKGTVAPVPGRGLSAPASFKLHFMHGGATTFLRMFFGIMEQYKVADERARLAFLDSAPAVQSFIATAHAAYVDPSDPSVIFITQPAAVESAGRLPRTAVSYAPVGVGGSAGGGAVYAPAAAPAPAPPAPMHYTSAPAGGGGAMGYAPAGAAPPPGVAYGGAGAPGMMAPGMMAYPPAYPGAPAAAAGPAPGAIMYVVPGSAPYAGAPPGAAGYGYPVQQQAGAAHAASGTATVVSGVARLF
jgi:hypothetical protein